MDKIVICLLLWSTIVPKQNTPNFLNTKLIGVGTRSGSGLGLELGLGYEAEAVLSALLRKLFLISQEPQAGRNDFLDCYNLSWTKLQNTVEAAHARRTLFG